MRATLLTTSLILAASAAASGAHADPAPHKLGPCDGIFASAAALSDYRFDGFSESNRHPSWQVTAFCYRNDGYFAGTTVTGVDFEDNPRTPVEADWYAGRQFQSHGFTTTLELLYASFPGKRAPGPSYDLFEPQVEVARTYKRLKLSGLVGWESDMSGAGREWHLKGSATLTLASWLTVSGHVGRFVGASGVDNDHNHFDVGATATWRRFSLDARYGGTDQPLQQCYYTNWCKPGASVSLTYRLYP
ncbi:MAG TPA: TorF family putative porin [Caulobacteraceae bacterium]|jgi:uncharacterized protein (TIGR02001 family)